MKNLCFFLLLAAISMPSAALAGGEQHAYNSKIITACRRLHGGYLTREQVRGVGSKYIVIKKRYEDETVIKKRKRFHSVDKMVAGYTCYRIYFGPGSAHWLYYRL